MWILSWYNFGMTQEDSTLTEMICNLENNVPVGRYLIRSGPFDRETSEITGNKLVFECDFDWQDYDIGVRADDEDVKVKAYTGIMLS